MNDLYNASEVVTILEAEKDTRIVDPKDDKMTTMQAKVVAGLVFHGENSDSLNSDLLDTALSIYSDPKNSSFKHAILHLFRESDKDSRNENVNDIYLSTLARFTKNKLTTLKKNMKKDINMEMVKKTSLGEKYDNSSNTKPAIR